MCKIKNIFGDFSNMEIATNHSMIPVFTIFDVLEGGFKIFDWFENFTLFRNNFWNFDTYGYNMSHKDCDGIIKYENFIDYVTIFKCNELMTYRRALFCPALDCIPRDRNCFFVRFREFWLAETRKKSNSDHEPYSQKRTKQRTPHTLRTQKWHFW